MGNDDTVGLLVKIIDISIIVIIIIVIIIIVIIISIIIIVIIIAIITIVIIIVVVIIVIITIIAIIIIIIIIIIITTINAFPGNIIPTCDRGVGKGGSSSLWARGEVSGCSPPQTSAGAGSNPSPCRSLQMLILITAPGVFLQRCLDNERLEDRARHSVVTADTCLPSPWGPPPPPPPPSPSPPLYPPPTTMAFVYKKFKKIVNPRRRKKPTVSLSAVTSCGVCCRHECCSIRRATPLAVPLYQVLALLVTAVKLVSGGLGQ
ncbi:hypothetical protein ACOMHN_009599 [Nucella lapillus]